MKTLCLSWVYKKNVFLKPKSTIYTQIIMADLTGLFVCLVVLTCYSRVIYIMLMIKWYQLRILWIQFKRRKDTYKKMFFGKSSHSKYL